MPTLPSFIRNLGKVPCIALTPNALVLLTNFSIFVVVLKQFLNIALIHEVDQDVWVMV